MAIGLTDTLPAMREQTIKVGNVNCVVLFVIASVCTVCVYNICWCVSMCVFVSMAMLHWGTGTTIIIVLTSHVHGRELKQISKISAYPFETHYLDTDLELLRIMANYFEQL